MNMHTALHRDLAATRIADLHRRAATRRTTQIAPSGLTRRPRMISAVARVAGRVHRPVTPAA